MKSLNIGISYWGICASFEEHSYESADTPDGHRYGRPILINELFKRGHAVYSLQKRRERNCYSLSWETRPELAAKNMQVRYTPDTFPELDVLFIEWRWPTYKNDVHHPDFCKSKAEPDLQRQTTLLSHYHGKVPIIIWDTDLKLTQLDELNWPRAIIADPSIRPRYLSRTRHQLPFWTDWKPLLDVAEPYPVYGYVGNNYERDDEFKNYYFANALTLRNCGIQTSMYGNWLQSSPERVSPDLLISREPNVAFNHRMDFYRSMQMMNRLICTTHVSKELYYKHGFISPRYLEALAVNCPGLVPMSMSMQKGVGDILGRQSTVGTASFVDRVESIKKLSIDERLELVEEQRAALFATRLFSVHNVVEFIEDVASAPQNYI